MPRYCSGFQDREPCRFGKKGNQAQPKPGNPRCSWCDQDLLRQVCDSIGGRRRLQQLYKKFTPEVAELARGRLPPEVRWSFPVPQPPEVAAPAPEQDAPAEPADHPRAEGDPPAAPASDESPSHVENDPEARPEPEPNERAPEAALAREDAAPPLPPLQVNLARAGSIDEAEAILVAHAAVMRPHLQAHWVAGDGNCLYRSVALQTPSGEESHLALRQQSTQEAGNHFIRYIEFFEDQAPAEVFGPPAYCLALGRTRPATQLLRATQPRGLACYRAHLSSFGRRRSWRRALQRAAAACPRRRRPARSTARSGRKAAKASQDGGPARPS